MNEAKRARGAVVLRQSPTCNRPVLRTISSVNQNWKHCKLIQCIPNTSAYRRPCNVKPVPWIEQQASVRGETPVTNCTVSTFWCYFCIIYLFELDFSMQSIQCEVIFHVLKLFTRNPKGILSKNGALKARA